MSYKIKLLAVCLLGLITTAYANERADSSKKFKPAALLQSNMVIQQNKPFKVWGFGPAGDAVEIHADWTDKVITAKADEQGNWLGIIKVPKATPGDFKPHAITIIHQKDVVKLDNILIGEVWLCSGQSNMEMRMTKIPNWGTGVLNYESELKESNYPAIRLCKVDMGIEFEPQADCHAHWTICDPKTAGDFSAVGYYFGRLLFNKLNVPIGMIDDAIPATACQAFINIDVLNADSVLKKKFVDPYAKGMAWIKERNDKNTTITTLEFPGLVYNKMIHPLTNLSIKGTIWYQGESNKDDTVLYTKLCSTMINSWRKEFDQGDFPFYYVQVAPFDWGFKGDSVKASYAKFREAQERILNVKNTGMAVIMDVGERANIHPLKKKPVGERLAKIALNKIYHLSDVDYQGPKFKKFTVKDNQVVVSFASNSIGPGLRTNDGNAPKYFFVAGPDKIFHQAVAKIINNQVWLKTDGVTNPVAVRYAFTGFPITNLENADNLPALPFRTDNWDN